MERVAAIILAGGASSRMGRDKASIELGGRTLLQRVLDAASEVADVCIVVVAPGQALPRLAAPCALRVTTDAEGGQGPLAGVLAGLDAAEVEEASVALLLACDQPFVRPALLRLLAARASVASAAFPVVEGRPQPLCSAVRLDAAGALRDAYSQGLRAMNVLTDIPGAVRLLPPEWQAADPEGLSFIGANTPDDLSRCEEIARRAG